MTKDPRITAYALGEIGAAEREQFEMEMAESDLLQSEVDAMLHLGKRLEALPKNTQRLDSTTREKLIADFANKQKARKTGRNAFIVVLSATLGVAAALVIFAGLSNFDLGSFQSGSGPWAKGAYHPGGNHAMRSLERATAYSAPRVSTESSKIVAQYLREADDAQEAPIPDASDLFASRAQTAKRAPMPQAAPPARAPAMISEAPAPQKLIAPQDQESLMELQALHSRVVEQEQSDLNTEAYASVRENEFVTAKENPLSTFSIDVDTASYSNVRRFLENESRPPAGAIRTEELINYFRYNYPLPQGEEPFSVNLEVGRAPWNPERELVRIGFRGRELPSEERGPANLVFLVDVSGSMEQDNKLPLLQRSLSELVKNLSDEDRVAIVTYAGSSGLVLAPTSGAKRHEILDAIANLQAGGSTHGSEGIRLAYETAREHFLKDGNNRVILCTDGDFNVGVTDQSELQKLIEKERESGVFLSVLGFGKGNLQDSTMELLADKGNGNYAYIDSISEGRKVLVEQMGSTLFTIAKDVKIQVEFNPARVAGYRLIGYENRLLAKEDFNDDKKDAGEIGAGHTVTALYEIIPAGQPVPGSPSVDPLKYQKPAAASGEAGGELLTVKLRYKAPDGDKSELLEIPLRADDIPIFGQTSEDFRFAASVAAFGMKLRGSPEAGKISWAEIQDIARGSLGEDPGSYRAEFLTLVEKAKQLDNRSGR
jgi:Ca-activated chloride channel family protein